MVLSDRFAGKPKPDLLKRTLMYVLGFGLGSLCIALGLGFAMVAITDGVLPSANASSTPADDPVDGEVVNVIGTPKNKAPSSRSSSRRAKRPTTTKKSSDRL